MNFFLMCCRNLVCEFPDKISNMDVGPSVPVNVPGLEELLAKEKELCKIVPDNDEKAKSKVSARGGVRR